MQFRLALRRNFDFWRNFEKNRFFLKGGLHFPEVQYSLRKKIEFFSKRALHFPEVQYCMDLGDISPRGPVNTDRIVSMAAPDLPPICLC